MSAAASHPATDWPHRLIAAVDRDNEFPPTHCEESLTLAALREAPEWAREHASLALADFTAAGKGGIGDLRADTVATHFTVAPTAASPNVLVARMLVPGGPWPGHRGIEAVVFHSGASARPAWFPELPDDGEAIAFAETVVASAALRHGQGHVIFPELLAVSSPPPSQSFGIVLVDHLESLYRTHAVPVAVELGWLAADGAAEAGELRTIAFHAHEWGHRAIDEGYAENVVGHQRRLLAVTSEVAADLAALDMLATSSHPLAPSVARALVLDRILRDAWLSRWEAHVASIVGRHHLQLLARIGALAGDGDGLALDLAASREAIALELAALLHAYRACNRGDDEAAAGYFTDNGWAVTAAGFALVSPDPVIEQVASRVRAGQAA